MKKKILFLLLFISVFSIFNISASQNNMLQSNSNEVEKTLPKGLHINTYISTTSKHVDGHRVFKAFLSYYWDDGYPILYSDDKVEIMWNNANMEVYSTHAYYNAYSNSGNMFSESVSNFNSNNYTVPLKRPYLKNKSGYMWVELYNKVDDNYALRIQGSYFHKSINFLQSGYSLTDTAQFYVNE